MTGTKQLAALSALSWALSACAGRAIDLDQHAASRDAGASAAGLTDAIVLPDKVGAVWVDDSRLYWTTDTTKLQGCLKSDCKNTVITYAPKAYQNVAVGGGHVYWTAGSYTIFSCPVEGCAGPPTKVVEDPTLTSSFISADGDYVYWSSDFDIYRCPSSGCGPTPEVVADHEFSTFPLVFDEHDAYWCNLHGLLSAAKDGSQPSRALIPSTATSLPFFPAVDATHIYWVDASQIFRCTVTGCGDSSPEALSTADTNKLLLKVNATGMYWLEGDSNMTSPDMTVAFCPLSGCDGASKSLTPAKALAFALDDAFVYWIESDGGVAGAKAIHRATK